MDIHTKLNQVESANISVDEKIKRLNNIILDLTNEMEAESQNMHPDINHDLALKLQVAQDCLRRIEEGTTIADDAVCQKVKSADDDLGSSVEAQTIKDACRVSDEK